ncbi:hypothetical protein AUP43_13825 [Oceanibaculum pacificum]|uniref:Uncharacterized protein n=1 Tax=Oceanibaculum pacificum TaxID=580166 RepID=A0A154VJR7_9PROT|nr:hypothetical protein AUP43_13825 [Oceanibaculum pacificum]
MTVLGALGVVLLVTGCQMNPLTSSNSITTSASAPAGGTRNGSPAPPPAFSQFSDVPLPANARMDLDKTIILGAEDGWIGRLALDASYPLTEMYAFYEREMPKFSWDRITVVRSSVTTMTYGRGARIATITLQPNGGSATTVDFTVSPQRISR